MIALVTSCIHPKSAPNIAKSFVSLNERESQTLTTIDKLKQFGFKKIYLLDNSYEFDFHKINELYPDLAVVHIKQFQFANKGINELLMLLYIVEELPENEIIFKISGRYFPNEHFNPALFDGDFSVRGYEFEKKTGTISTRAYFVKNKIIYKEFLLQTLNEVFLYPQRIVGLRSLIRLVTSLFSIKFSPAFNTSIEFAAARVLKNSDYKVVQTDKIGISGTVAGFESKNEINE